MTWHPQNSKAPTEVWDLAIEKVLAGEHLVPAVIKAVFELWGGTDDEYNGTKWAPEVRALELVREQEGAVTGTDFFASYTPEQAAEALRKVRDSA